MFATSRKPSSSSTRELGVVGGLRRVAIRAARDCLDERDARALAHDRVARAHLADSIRDRLELRRLVHHVDRRRDLAAVVQPARDVQLVPLRVRQIEGRERALLGLAHRLRQQLGQHRDASAVTARVRRLVVDRGGDEFDERLHQLALRPEEHLVVERDRGL